jgi:hypothetical protein
MTLAIDGAIQTRTTTMQRRKFLVGLGSLAAGGAAAVGTGAFNSVEADRRFAVEIAGDNYAYLGLSGTGTSNDEYLTQTGSGNTLAIALTDSNVTTGGGDGINDEAETIINPLFEVTNQGTQEIWVYFQLTNAGFFKNTARLFPAGNESAQGLDSGKSLSAVITGGTPPHATQSISNRVENVAAVLGPGDSQEVGVYFNTKDGNTPADKGVGDSANDLNSNALNAFAFDERSDLPAQVRNF